MLGCTECVTRVFGDVVFHPDGTYVFPPDRLYNLHLRGIYTRRLGAAFPLYCVLGFLVCTLFFTTS